MEASLKELCGDIQILRKTKLLEKGLNFMILGYQTNKSLLTPHGRCLVLQFPNCM